MRSRLIYTFIMLILLGMISACSRETEPAAGTDGSIRIYCLNRSETALAYEEHVCEAQDKEGMVRELLGAMSNDMNDSDHRAPLQFDFTVMSIVLEGDRLILDLSSSYTEMSPTREILVRAAIVRTLTQVDGVDAVSLMVDGLPLTDIGGNAVGTMTADSFVDNEGVEINAYDKVTLHLYFAGENGDKLVECSRSVMYNTNLPLERLVLEELIQGPELEEGEPVLDPSTKVISVTVTDGVCFVNLDSDFLNSVGNVTPYVSIYSVVNSLAELNTVHKVQFMVNGESDVMFREILDLEQQFSRNLDIVE